MTVLEIIDAYKSYGGVAALGGCTTSVKQHSITALIGPNGAGKTTLFNAINGFTSLDRGQVQFFGQNVSELPAWKRSRLGMSRTFQGSRAFKNLSIKDNCLLALRQDDDHFFRSWFVRGDTEAELAEIAKILDFVGLDKPLDTPATDLSFGQQKLFALALALLNPHKLLLLDEPVAGVNPVLRIKLGQLLRDLKEQDESVLLVEHDMGFVSQVADHVIVMDQGRVLTEGRPELVLQDKRVLESYLGKAI